jgi:hypothetical protein
MKSSLPTRDRTDQKVKLPSGARQEIGVATMFSLNAQVSLSPE